MGLLRRRGTVALLGVFAVLRIAAAVRHPQVFHDSAGYTPLNFLGGQTRLWTVPLVYNLLPANVLREAFQILLGIGAWSVLALTIARLISDRYARAAAVAIVLLLGLIPTITVWDGDMLSESVSISLMVLIVAGILQLGRAASARTLMATLGAVLFWVFVRQENAVVYLVLLPVVVCFTLWRLPRRTAALLTCGMLMIGGWAGYCIASQGPRVGPWTYNAAEVAVDRIAPEPAMRAYFVAHGMPLAPVLASKTQPDDARWLYYNREFMRWVYRSFRHVYLGYLLGHPSQVTIEPLSHLTDEISPNPIAAGYGHPRPVGTPSGADAPWRAIDGLIVMLAVAGAGVALYRKPRSMTVRVALGRVAFRRKSRPLAVPLFLFLWCVVMAVNTYDFATKEYDRLFVPVGLTLRLGLLLLAAFAADALLLAFPVVRVQAGKLIHHSGETGEPDQVSGATAG